ncbi:hypothetical protein [Muricoccus radiodurans]|uniref:hypothetical protein n=1 Tax=Muricoccus radiodurans TaxID=2231721 RepID=UPI003CE8268D
MSIIARMAALKTGTGNGAFPKIPRAKFIRTLEQRIADPDSIRQAVSSLCGPASLLRSVLLDNPEMYVRYAIDMYERGQAKLGKLDVEPSSDCRECDTKEKVAAVDWVTLASLRDSENDVFDYDDVDDLVGGITMPEDLADWFEKCGYVNARNNTSVLLTEGRDTLQEALDCHAAGMRTCLLIEAEMIDGDGKGNAVFANHWVMLGDSWGLRPGLDVGWVGFRGDGYGGGSWTDDAADPWVGGSPGNHVIDDRVPRGNGDEVDLTLWSWGDWYRTNKFGPMSWKSFEKRFHGYVAARFRFAY